MKEKASLRHEMDEAFRNMATLQASFERLKQEDLGSECRVRELERKANMSEQQAAPSLRVSDRKLREAAQHHGRAEREDETLTGSSHCVKIYNEQGEEARRKLIEHERMRNQLSAAVGKQENQLRYEEESATVNKNCAEEINHASIC